MQKTINDLSIRLGIPREVIWKVYEAFWSYIRQSIESIPLKENLTEEEFNKIRTNFNIPNLGKLSCTYDRYLGIKKKRKYLQDGIKHKKDKANG